MIFWIRKIYNRKLRFHEYIREDGLRIVDLPDVVYGTRCPGALFRALGKGHKFRKINRISDFMKYMINFSVDEKSYVFYSDDWGGGFVCSGENDGDVADLLKIMRASSRFVEFGARRNASE